MNNREDYELIIGFGKMEVIMIGIKVFFLVRLVSV